MCAHIIRYGCATLGSSKATTLFAMAEQTDYPGTECTHYCTNQRGLHREKARRRCLSDLGWNADGVPFDFLFFLFLIFLFGFREGCQKDSLNLGERLVDGRSGKALVWSWVTQIPEGNGIGNKGFEGRGRAHGWCGMLS